MKFFDKSVIIRPAKLDDAEQIVAIYNHYVKDTIVTFDTDLKSSFEFRNEMMEVIKKCPYYVAEKEGQILGYAMATDWKSRCSYKYSVESSIYMDPSHKGKGIGYKLYFKLLKELKNTEIHAVIAGISLPNVVSVELHQKMGFEKIAHFKEVGYKFNRWIDVGYWELIFPFRPEQS